jgi:hypothetical protein
VTVQRSEVTSCNFTAPIATFGASSNPREFLLHPNRTEISQPKQSDGSRPVSRSLVARCSRIRSLRTSSLTGRLVLRSPIVLISANQFLASGPALFTFPSKPQTKTWQARMSQRAFRLGTIGIGSRLRRGVHSLSLWCLRVAVYFSTYSVRNFSPPLSWTMAALSFAATKCGRPAGIRTKLPAG